MATDMLRMVVMYKRTGIYALLLAALACIPAAIQLGFDGFTVPVSMPFGVTLEEALKEPNPVVWVDARPEDMFKTGHIPGALNLNRTNWGKSLSQLFGCYAPGKEVIVYCSAGCAESEEIAKQIRNLGLEPVLVLVGGFDAWQKANPGS
jgi:rhodanese-related sulfurtransferase